MRLAASHGMGAGEAVADTLRLHPQRPSLIWISHPGTVDGVDPPPSCSHTVQTQSASTTLAAAVRLAQRLKGTGVPRGSIVALLLGASDPSPWLPVTTLAAWLSGFCVSFVPWASEPPVRRKALMEAVQPRLCISFGLTVQWATELPTHHFQITLDDVWPSEDKTLAEDFGDVILEKLQEREGSPWDPAGTGDWACLSLTSGTTGKPKACFLSHHALLSYARGRHAVWPSLTHSSRVALVSSPSFDPYAGDIALAWTVGAPLVLGPTPGPFIDLLLGELGRATHVTSTPAALLGSRLVEGGVGAFPWLEAIALGGEPIPMAMQTALQGRLWNVYGTTEMGVYQSSKRVDLVDARPTSREGTNCGCVFAVDMIQVFIVVHDERTDSLREAAVGEVGEVAIGGTILDHTACLNPMSGSPGWSTHGRHIVSGDRVYTTGDLGRLDAVNGELWIIGRKDDQVKVRGIRIALGEVEALIAQAGAGLVTAVCALMLSEGECKGDKLVVACALCDAAWNEVRLHSGASSTIEAKEAKENIGFYRDAPLAGAILGRARQIGAAALLPSVLMFSATLPSTCNGKIDRPLILSSLRSSTECGNEFHVSSVRAHPHTLTEAVVSMAWALDLKIPAQRLGRDDTFVALGGDSLVALRTARRLAAIASGGPLDTSARFAGGKYGDEGVPPWANPFDMLGEITLQQYASHLDRSGAGSLLRMYAPDGATSLLSATTSETPEDFTSLSAWEALVTLACRDHRPLLLSCMLVWDGATPHGIHTGRNFGMSPLSTACRVGAISCAKLLLDAGANPNAPDAKRRMPLHACAEEGHTELLALLLAHDGLHLHAKDQAKQTALHHAARGGSAEAVAMIASAFKRKDHQDAAEKLSRGVRDTKCLRSSLDLRDRWSRTAVHWACVNGHDRALHALLEAGALPDIISKKSTLKASTSLAYESPMDICVRLNGPGGGNCGALLQGYASGSLSTSNDA